MVLALMACADEQEVGWFVDLHGRLIDEAGAAVAGAEGQFVTSGGSPVGTTVTEEDGTWHLPLFGTELGGHEMVAVFVADGMADLRMNVDIDLATPVSVSIEAGPWQSWQMGARRVPTLRMAAESEAATVEGEVVDALTGAGVPALTLRFQQGWNARVDDPALAEIVTDAVGGFSFVGWPAGWYTVSVSPTETTDPARFPAFVTGSGGRVRGAVSPHVAVGQLRAALMWGAAPGNLDLHLSAPLAGGQAGQDGNGHYHVWANEPTHPDADVEGTGFEAAIERIAEYGVGPETIGVYSPPGAGEIRFSVVNMDVPPDDPTSALADSGAFLQVWDGADIPRYFTISPREVANWWQPMVLDAETRVVWAVESYAVGVDAEDADAF